MYTRTQQTRRPVTAALDIHGYYAGVIILYYILQLTTVDVSQQDKNKMDKGSFVLRIKLMTMNALLTLRAHLSHSIRILVRICRYSMQSRHERRR